MATINEAINGIVGKMTSSLSFLDNAFGKAEIIDIISTSGDEITIPAMLGYDDYKSLMPCDSLGNYSFFITDEPNTVDVDFGNGYNESVDCSLIVWFKQSGQVTKESVKSDLLQFFTFTNFNNCSLRLKQIYERQKSIFTEFDLDVNQNQCLTYPYFGYRIEFELKTKMECFL